MLLWRSIDLEVISFVVEVKLQILKFCFLFCSGKRSQQTAALESGSNVVPREMARMASGQVSGGGLLDTPDCSGQIGGQAGSNGHMSGYLNNCRQINDL